MLKKLDWVHPRMEELGMLLSDPAVVQDQEKWRALMREHSQLEPLDQAVRRYAELEDAQKQARAARRARHGRNGEGGAGRA